MYLSSKMSILCLTANFTSSLPLWNTNDFQRCKIVFKNIDIPFVTQQLVVWMTCYSSFFLRGGESNSEGFFCLLFRTSSNICDFSLAQPCLTPIMILCTAIAPVSDKTSSCRHHQNKPVAVRTEDPFHGEGWIPS